MHQIHLFQRKISLVQLFSILMLGILMFGLTACDDTPENSGPNLSEMGPRLEKSVVYTGQVSVTVYYQEPCTKEGTGTLTLDTDRNLFLDTVSPMVGADCTPDSSQEGWTVRGTYNTKLHTLKFTTCNSTDMTAAGSATFSDTEASGWVECSDSSGAKNSTIRFTLTK